METNESEYLEDNMTLAKDTAEPNEEEDADDKPATAFLWCYLFDYPLF